MAVNLYFVLLLNFCQEPPLHQAGFDIGTLFGVLYIQFIHYELVEYVPSNDSMDRLSLCFFKTIYISDQPDQLRGAQQVY